MEVSHKQDTLNIIPNSIKDLDSFWNGLYWYNENQGVTGDLPFEGYGFILALTSGENHIQIAVPFGGMMNENIRVRSYSNKRWYNWKSISRRHASFVVTPNPSFGGTIVVQECYCNLETSEVHIFFIVKNMTGMKGTGTPIVTIPEAYRPLSNKAGIGSVLIGATNYWGNGVVRTNGAITQSISSLEVGTFIFMAHYWISD